MGVEVQTLEVGSVFPSLHQCCFLITLWHLWEWFAHLLRKEGRELCLPLFFTFVPSSIHSPHFCQIFLGTKSYYQIHCLKAPQAPSPAAYRMHSKCGKASLSPHSLLQLLGTSYMPGGATTLLSLTYVSPSLASSLVSVAFQHPAWKWAPLWSLSSFRIPESLSFDLF